MKKQASGTCETPVFRSGPKELLLWVFQQRKRYRIAGDSMLPSLASGDHVLTQPCEHARVGDIVVCRHPFVADSYVIKRVKEVGTEGLFLEGDNRTSSTDSNSFGVVPWSRLVAKVTSIL